MFDIKSCVLSLYRNYLTKKIIDDRPIYLYTKEYTCFIVIVEEGQVLKDYYTRVIVIYG